MINFLKSLWFGMFCTHEKTTEKMFYCNESPSIPVISVYHSSTCKRCGKEFTTKVSEYPSCYYDLSDVVKVLKSKGIQNLEDIMQEKIKASEKNEN